jgi:hypothetical protein
LAPFPFPNFPRGHLHATPLYQVLLGTLDARCGSLYFSPRALGPSWPWLLGRDPSPHQARWDAAFITSTGSSVLTRWFWPAFSSPFLKLSVV